MSFPAEIRRQLVHILGADHVKDDRVTLYAYRADGLTLHPREPMGVLFPGGTDELVEVVKLLHHHGISFLPRGAGTGLSGGAIPSEGSVIIEMVRFNRIQNLNTVDRTITVGPGVINLHVSKAAELSGLCFVPDPSSQKACSIGGNVAENSGGPHTLKYGVTVNHVLSLEVVLPDGQLVRLGNPNWGVPGPDLTGLFVGTEGTFAIVTSVICRLTPLPEKVVTLLGIFPSVRDACQTVSDTISAGIVPAAMEMVDEIVIGALEEAFQVGFPLDAAAVLIIELEDLAEGIEDEATQIREICARNHAREIRQAKDETERALIWQARKEAFGAMGTISPCFYTQDGVIPRSSLPDVLDKIQAIGKRHGLRVANIFHAGDGNLHPLIPYDPHDSEQVAAVQKAGDEILQVCLEMGGTLSGEHGIGLEKAHLMELVFNEDDQANMRRIREVFNPDDLLNPGKIFTTPGQCSETKMIYRKTGVQA